jgi:hypothetical protein
MRRNHVRRREIRSVEVEHERPATRLLLDQKAAYDGRSDSDCAIFAYSPGQFFVVPTPPIAAAPVVLEVDAVDAFLVVAGEGGFDAGVHGNEEIEVRQATFGVEEFGGGGALFGVAAVRRAGFEADVVALVDTEGFADAATLVPAVVEASASFPLLVAIATAVAVAELLHEIG